MSNFNDWINSGRFVYLLMTEADYASRETTAQKYPDAPLIAGYRLLTIDRKNATERYEQFAGVPHTFGFTDGQSEPALLTHAQASDFVAANAEDLPL